VKRNDNGRRQRGTFYPLSSSVTTRQKSAPGLISFAPKTVWSRL
jgi:hypothetical protein